MYPVCVSNSFVIKEESVALLDLIATLKDTREVDESTEIIELDENRNHEKVTLNGCAIAEVIKGDQMRLDLHLTTLDGRVGVAANIKEASPIADYFQCAMHALNLSCVCDQ
jgi:hypothetical protein